MYSIVDCCQVFLFVKQKTAYELRISDWSSDVCSSELAESHIGRRDHFVEQDAERIGQTLPAIGGVGDQRRPAAIHQRLVSFLEARRRRDDAVFQLAAHLIANRVERLENFFGKLGGFLQNLVDNIEGRIPEAGKVRILRQVERVVQGETIFLDGKRVG